MIGGRLFIQLADDLGIRFGKVVLLGEFLRREAGLVAPGVGRENVLPGLRLRRRLLIEGLEFLLRQFEVVIVRLCSRVNHHRLVGFHFGGNVLGHFGRFPAQGFAVVRIRVGVRRHIAGLVIPFGLVRFLTECGGVLLGLTGGFLGRPGRRALAPVFDHRGEVGRLAVFLRCDLRVVLGIEGIHLLCRAGVARNGVVQAGLVFGVLAGVVSHFHGRAFLQPLVLDAAEGMGIDRGHFPVGVGIEALAHRCALFGADFDGAQRVAVDFRLHAGQRLVGGGRGLLAVLRRRGFVANPPLTIDLIDLLDAALGVTVLEARSAHFVGLGPGGFGRGETIGRFGERVVQFVAVRRFAPHGLNALRQFLAALSLICVHVLPHRLMPACLQRLSA